MRTVWIGAIAAVLAVGVVVSAEERSIDLKVLYAGKPDSDWATDFVTFLEKHFSQVTRIHLGTLEDSSMKGRDVAIIDWNTVYNRDKNGEIVDDGKSVAVPPAPKLSQDYDRPTILIGYVGGRLTWQLPIFKIIPLCLTLNDQAHGVESYHDIFGKPFGVDLLFEEIPAPARCLTSPGIRTSGPSLMVWRVQTKTSPEIDPGQAYHPVGVEDSPDAEVISGGIQTNGSYGMAIARQGNFLFWGFYAQPSHMTPEARRAFLNAICYIRRFDGQKPLVQSKATSREWFHQQAQFLTATSDKDTITSLLMAFPWDLRRQFGSKKEKYAEYYEKNLEFIYGSDAKEKGLTKKVFLADEDLKSLNLSNRKVETLDVCVGMLERGEKMDVARRILKRYITEDFPTAAEWRKWLTENRDYLFFSDVGGYRWYVDTLAKERAVPTEQLRGPARANPLADSLKR